MFYIYWPMSPPCVQPQQSSAKRDKKCQITNKIHAFNVLGSTCMYIYSGHTYRTPTPTTRIQKGRRCHAIYCTVDHRLSFSPIVPGLCNCPQTKSNENCITCMLRQTQMKAFVNRRLHTESDSSLPPFRVFSPDG